MTEYYIRIYFFIGLFDCDCYTFSICSSKVFDYNVIRDVLNRYIIDGFFKVFINNNDISIHIDYEYLVDSIKCIYRINKELVASLLYNDIKVYNE